MISGRGLRLARKCHRHFFACVCHAIDGHRDVSLKNHVIGKNPIELHIGRGGNREGEEGDGEEAGSHIGVGEF